MTASRRPQIAGLAVLTGLVIVLLVINLVHDRMSDLLPPTAGMTAGAKLGTALAVMLSLKFWIPAIVPLAFLGALAAVGGIFNRLQAGKPFDDSLIRGVKQLGHALIVVGIAGCIVVPVLTAWEAGDYGGLPFRLATEHVAVGLIGVALNLVATQAHRLRAELEQFV